MDLSYRCALARLAGGLWAMEDKLREVFRAWTTSGLWDAILSGLSAHKENDSITGGLPPIKRTRVERLVG